MSSRTRKPRTIRQQVRKHAPAVYSAAGSLALCAGICTTPLGLPLMTAFAVVAAVVAGVVSVVAD